MSNVYFPLAQYLYQSEDKTMTQKALIINDCLNQIVQKLAIPNHTNEIWISQAISYYL